VIAAFAERLLLSDAARAAGRFPVLNRRANIIPYAGVLLTPGLLITPLLIETNCGEAAIVCFSKNIERSTVIYRTPFHRQGVNAVEKEKRREEKITMSCAF
jgi:hypothetical protein